jgi:hypothetical protein
MSGAILTGAKLAELGEAVWGAEWASVLATRLRKARKTIYRWRDSGPPAEARAQIEAAVEDQLALVARYHEELKAEGDVF